MENKKIKLTISGVAKKSIRNIELAKTQSKNSVVIEKKPSRFTNKSSLKKFSPSGHKGKSFMGSRSSGFSKHINPITNDFEKRKLAEQRATRRVKGEVPSKDSKLKIGSKKRELFVRALLVHPDMRHTLAWDVCTLSDLPPSSETVDS